MSKKRKKQTIRIYFIDGKCDEIPQKLWDDYELNDNLFVVKRRGAWIGIYNMAIVACITVG